VASVPIRSSVVTAAPKDYAIPPSQEIILLSVTAEFIDNGAAGDWLPAVVILDNNGNALCRAVDQGVKVTAGGDAEVSWFPGVKVGGGGVQTVTPEYAFLYLGRALPGSGDPTQTIPSGVVTPIAWHERGFAGGFAEGSMVSPAFGATSLVWAVVGPNAITLTVTWPSAAFDRYIEIGVTGPQDIGTLASPRLRTSATPDGDRMTLTAVVAGDPSVPTSVSANLFQASGVDQAIHAEMSFQSIRTGIFVT